MSREALPVCVVARQGLPPHNRMREEGTRVGLDMYLYARVETPKDSALAKVITEHVTEDHIRQMAVTYDDGEKGTAYVSGWSFPGKEPESLYVALAEEMNFKPHEGSPHFSIADRGDHFTIDSTLFYWRKANAIHRWFVDNAQGGVDDCNEYEVHPEVLADLVDRCSQVAADHSKAGDLLPTQGGFFFGPTEYDDWYFDDIENTAKDLKERVMRVPAGTKFIYRSSW